MKRIIFVSLLMFSITICGQEYYKFENLSIDSYQLHNCNHSLIASDGNIIMLEACYEGDNEVGSYLLKSDRQGNLIKSVYTDFKSIQFFNPFIRDPFKENCNIMSGFYANWTDVMYHYEAVFFDDDLNIINTVDVPFDVEGFNLSYSLSTDINNDIIISCETGEQKQLYVKMDVYGNIKDINYIELPSDWRRTLFHFNVHNNDPIQYGCTFFNIEEHSNGWFSSDGTAFYAVLDEHLKLMHYDTLLFYDETTKYNHFMWTNMISLKDGNIATLSMVSKTNASERTIQLTKYDKELNVIGSKAVSSIFNDVSPQIYSIEGKSIIECHDGSLYAIYRDKKNDIIYIIHLDNDLNIQWELEIADTTYPTFLSAHTLDDGSLVLAGYDLDVNDNITICYIIKRDGTFTSEYPSSSNNFSIYPNPASDFVKISSTSSQPSVVKVYNCLGMLVEEFEMNSEEIEINVSDYNSGVYFVEVDGEVVKVVKN